MTGSVDTFLHYARDLEDRGRNGVAERLTEPELRSRTGIDRERTRGAHGPEDRRFVTAIGVGHLEVVEESRDSLLNLVPLSSGALEASGAWMFELPSSDLPLPVRRPDLLD